VTCPVSGAKLIPVATSALIWIWWSRRRTGSFPVLAMGSMDPRLLTDRLVLREGRVEDAAEALGVHGHPEVARWLSPEMDQVPDVVAMRLLLQQWIAEDARTAAAGRCAIERRADWRLLGGAILLRLPPGLEDLELGWQLHQ
jgi:RimJ/RimL family protein N-acetyltransferase